MFTTHGHLKKVLYEVRVNAENGCKKSMKIDGTEVS
jgi:hypothetical protein